MSSTRLCVVLWCSFLLVLVRLDDGCMRPPSTPPPIVGAFRHLPWRQLFRGRSDECGGFRPRSILSCMILLCGDVEPNPGPALGHGQYGCGYCEELCRSGQGAVACDNCSEWFHKDCFSMSSDSLVRIKAGLVVLPLPKSEQFKFSVPCIQLECLEQFFSASRSRGR